MVANPREDRYADTAPPPDWKPKSAFFKAIWAKAHFDLTHKRVTLTCPCCGEQMTVQIKVLTND